MSDEKHTKADNSEPVQVSGPAIVITWDPKALSNDEYVALVNAIGNVVRAHGGLGIQLLQQFTREVSDDNEQTGRDG